MNMERRELESAAATYAHLRGLFGIPGGLLAILAALGNWEWGPLRHAWIFLGVAAVLAAASLLISRYYAEHYGRVTLSRAQRRRAAAAVIVGAPLMFGAALLLRSRAGWSLDLPVNAIPASFALLMLATYAAGAVLRTHHVIIFGALAVAGLLPVWDGADPSNTGLVLVGAAIIATGILDHRLLVRTFGPPKGLKLSNAGA
jgi:hypothetical protein